MMRSTKKERCQSTRTSIDVTRKTIMNDTVKKTLRQASDFPIAVVSAKNDGGRQAFRTVQKVQEVG